MKLSPLSPLLKKLIGVIKTRRGGIFFLNQGTKGWFLTLKNIPEPLIFPLFPGFAGLFPSFSFVPSFVPLLPFFLLSSVPLIPFYPSFCPPDSFPFLFLPSRCFLYLPYSVSFALSMFFHSISFSCFFPEMKKDPEIRAAQKDGRASRRKF